MTLAILRLRFIQEKFKGFEKTLLFYTEQRTQDGWSPLRSACLDLAQSARHEIRLHAEPLIRAHNVKVIAKRIESSEVRDDEKRVTQLHLEGIPTFLWLCDGKTWSQHASYIEGVIRWGGHQYLSSEMDDAMIMISNGGYSDKDFES